jgi:hypothetical protein
VQDLEHASTHMVRQLTDRVSAALAEHKQLGF